MDERRFPRSVHALEAIFAFVDRFATSHGVSDHHAFELRLAIEELFTNMVKYHPEAQAEIALALHREGPWVRVVLKDSGVERWDPTRAPEFDPGRSDRPDAGGRGLHLVRQTMDEFHYDYQSGCSTITLAKRVED